MNIYIPPEFFDSVESKTLAEGGAPSSALFGLGLVVVPKRPLPLQLVRLLHHRRFLRWDLRLRLRYAGFNRRFTRHYSNLNLLLPFFFLRKYERATKREFGVITGACYMHRERERTKLVPFGLKRKKLKAHYVIFLNKTWFENNMKNKK